MRILVVDDSQDKIKNIINTILEIDGIKKEDIEYAVETSVANSSLRENRYDVIILDLFMPECILDGSTENAGADLIDEILRIESIKKPLEIVILSAYDSYSEAFIKDDKRNAFRILKYDENSEVWKKQLKAIIKYRQLYYLQNAKEQVDYAIITSVPVETEAIRNLTNEWEIITFENDSLQYYIGCFSENGKKKKVVSVQSSDMGMVSATISVMNLHKHFKPKYFFITGIAAGIGGPELGDILIPSAVWNYTSGKYVVKDGKLEFLPEPQTIPLDERLTNLVKGDFSSVLKTIHDSWPTKNEIDLEIKKRNLKLYCAPLACGTAVVANFDIVKDFILNHSRKTLGVDMEAYGVFSAVRSLCDEKPIAICVKSISDFADKDKEDGYQPYASYTSACFTKHLIMNVLE